MLAVKRVLAGLGPAGLYVFDEVDAGIGGAMAEVIGRKLKQVSRHHQVICITHLPQIAVWGDAHFRVCKAVEKGALAAASSAWAARNGRTRSRACWEGSRSRRRPGPPLPRCSARGRNMTCDRGPLSAGGVAPARPEGR